MTLDYTQILFYLSVHRKSNLYRSGNKSNERPVEMKQSPVPVGFKSLVQRSVSEQRKSAGGARHQALLLAEVSPC